MNDPASILVTFALPAESRDFRRALADRQRLHPRDHLSPVRGQLAGRPVVVCHTGVGDSAACRRRLTSVLRTGPARLAISAGYAGGLDPALRVGDLLFGANYSTPATIAAARAALAARPPRLGRLLTQLVPVETVASKAALRASTGADAVDMETAWIADACASARLPLLSLRVVSDAADQPFPLPGRVLFDAARQRPRYLALPFHLLTHPAAAAPFARFVRGLIPARVRLTRSLCRLVAAL